MAEEAEVTQRREELKRQLAAGEYKTLIDLLLDGTGDLIKKLTRSPEPPSYWYSAMVIALVTLLIAYLTSLLLREFYLFRNGCAVNILVGILFEGMTLACVIAVKKYTDVLLRTAREKLLDAIQSSEDLADLQQWLDVFSNLGKSLFFSLAFGILASSYAIIYFPAIGRGFIGFGPSILAVIGYVQGGMALYYSLFLFLPFPVRLSRYQLKLNPVNPGSSEVIDSLSDTLSYLVYASAIFLAFFTFFLVFTGTFSLLNIILSVVVGWGPLIVIFLIGQYALAQIITRAKWTKLNEIQAKIEMLEAEEDVPSEKTLAHLGKLMDYYDRIKATRNSALNLRAGLNFLNSLLLPLLAFILGNLDQMRDVFR
jgi:hypothetical protein